MGLVLHEKPSEKQGNGERKALHTNCRADLRRAIGCSYRLQPEAGSGEQAEGDGDTTTLPGGEIIASSDNRLPEGFSIRP